MAVKLELYRIFRTVAEEESISAAAKTLFISQSAVSQSIHQLEEQLQVRLFSRQPRGVTLTGEGRVLYDYVRSAINLIETGEEKVQQTRELMMGELVIGASDTVTRSLLLPYLLRRKAAFRDFIGALPKSAPMQTEADFAAHRADYRAVVCGSDQIWNPGSLDFSTHFFAPDFAAQKISYAPSLRSATAAEFADIDLKGLLADFAALSVREQESVAVIEQLTGRTPKVVLDPTLLPAAQDFAPILGTAPQGDYLFFYSIDYPPEVCRTVQQTARRLHLPVYILFTGNKTYRALPYGFRLARHQTPGDFLALVKGAKLVLSTSFHGTVFALRFGTPFYALKAKRGAAYYTDPRIATLLQTAGVAERYLPCDRAGEIHTAPLHRDPALLDRAVAESRAFLQEGLTAR